MREAPVFAGLLCCRDEFRRRGGVALFGATFLLNIKSAVSDLVVEGFNFACEAKILGISCVCFEESVSLRFQVVAFLFPETSRSNHGFDLRISVHSFFVGG